ncbi:hypothetical protein FRC07_006465 [Ceratobasidium sp. 392]|nr:hypothetical protein FRC07_006465 [Ceratobasidium sp. 392]
MASNECRNTCFTPARSLPNPKAPPFAIVCAQWRQLYLRWHVASSHLDLIVGGSVADAYYHYAEARAANSIDAPIHLSIRDWVNKSVNAKAVSVDEVAKLISFVTPLLPRVCAIDITFKFRSQRLLDSVVSSWAKCGSSILPKVFKVWNTSESGPLELKAPTESPTEFRDFFSPLQTLALYNCTIASDTSVYRGLVDLRIDWLHNDASPLNITDILAASPNLRSLAVEDVKFVELGENIEMIPLMSLQNISVSQSKIENSLKHLLPLLDTGSNSTNVIMRVILPPDFIPESRAFFLRSSVKRIFTYGNERYHHSIVASLCPAPDLQELVLRDCSLKYDPDEDSSITDENGNTCTPWPLLHTLYLVGCTFEFEALRKFVLSHPMRKLRVYNGYIQPDVRRKMKPEECEELEGMFSQTGIDVKCVQDEVDCPTRLNFFDGLYA